MVSDFPIRYTLGIRRLIEGAADVYGNASTGHGPAEPWPVHGYYRPVGAEPWREGRDLSTVDVTVLAPAAGPLPGPHDLVDLEGAEYAVEGGPGDYSRGPFGWAAGAVVDLRRVEG